jgi:hypothetical protein
VEQIPNYSFVARADCVAVAGQSSYQAMHHCLAGILFSGDDAKKSAQDGGDEQEACGICCAFIEDRDDVAVSLNCECKQW